VFTPIKFTKEQEKEEIRDLEEEVERKGNLLYGKLAREIEGGHSAYTIECHLHGMTPEENGY
jgi:hypothetical protein